MAVNPTQTPENIILIRDFWKKFKYRTYVAISAAQSSVILAIFILLQVSGLINLDIFVFFAAFIITALLQNLVTMWLIKVLGRPFYDLVQTVVHISGVPTTEKPPNPNYYKNNNDGFREILQLLYELSSENSALTAKQLDAQESTDNYILDGLDNSQTGVIILDKDQKIIYHNKYAPVRKNTHDTEELDLIFPEHDSFNDWIKSGTRNKLRADNTWLRVSNRLPGDEDRKIYDVAVNFHKNSAAEIVITTLDQTANYNPEEDDLDFISFAAHELRGPITVIRGYLDVLTDELEPVLQDDQHELMQRLIVTSNRLSSYVNNILNASKYDRRHLKLHLHEHKLDEIYDTISDDMELRARSQNRLLAVEIPKNLPTVAADENAIGEVLSNLIDNAIKYSYEGGLVHVFAKIIPGFIEVSIEDHGVGMPSNVVSNLFHKFYRSHRSRDTVAGTGIGLYICRAIISSHGGTIIAQSVENEGSTFTFTIPIYDTVADKLLDDSVGKMSLIESKSDKTKSIQNHSMNRE